MMPRQFWSVPPHAESTMFRARAAVAACVIASAALIGAAACSRQQPGAEPVHGTSAAETPDARVEGAPQIATSTDGVHIEYHVYGHGDPAVILVHGWACDANYWKAQLDELKSRYTTVTVDLAGHGASGSNRTDWSMANFGDDVAAVARQLQNPKIVLVGHSMGAVVVLEAARRIGDRVVGIAAVDALKTIGQPPMPEAELERRLKPFRDDFIGHMREFVAGTFFAPHADPVFVRKVAYDMSLEPEQIAISTMEALWRMDFTEVLPDIHVPVVAITSDRTPVDEARIRKSLPGFRAISLEHTGHFLMMEAPERFNPILVREIDAMLSR